MNKKNEIITHLEFLIVSAKEREIEQGIKTFSYFVHALKETDSPKDVFEDLYSQLSGMQRFADFSRTEWEVVKQIFKLIEST